MTLASCDKMPCPIDGIVAAIIGLSRAMFQEPVERSVYETRGLLEFEF